MEDIVAKILERNGPCLSSEVIRVLVTRYKLSEDAARQRIRRRSSKVSSLRFLSFPRNAKFLYLRSDYGSPDFFDALVKTLRDSSPAYAAALASLIERGGIMPRQHFYIACGAPIKQKRQLSAEKIIQALMVERLIEQVDVPGIGECLSYSRGHVAYFERQITEMRTRLIIEDLMLRAIKSWARNLAFASYDKFALRGEGNLPRVGTFAWDLTAPSYLSGLIGRSDPRVIKPGFVTCDVLLGRTVTEAGIQPFIRKCQMIRALKNIGRCMHIFVAEAYAPSAFDALRQIGLIPATPESLFGTEVAAAFIELSRTLMQAATITVDPVKLDWIFRQLGKIEGAAQSLRGALFEFVVAEMIRKLWPARVTMNHIFRVAGQEVAEVDVVAIVENRRIHFIECKGQTPHQTVDDAEVKKWLTKRIPLVRKQALEHPDWKHLEMHFELWTSGHLSPEADAMVAAAKSRKYNIMCRNGADVSVLANELQDQSLTKVLRQHFLNHPLSSAEFLKAVEYGDEFKASSPLAMDSPREPARILELITLGRG